MDPVGFFSLYFDSNPAIEAAKNDMFKLYFNEKVQAQRFFAVLGQPDVPIDEIDDWVVVERPDLNDEEMTVKMTSYSVELSQTTYKAFYKTIKCGALSCEIKNFNLIARLYLAVYFEEFIKNLGLPNNIVSLSDDKPTNLNVTCRKFFLEGINRMLGILFNYQIEIELCEAGVDKKAQTGAMINGQTAREKVKIAEGATVAFDLSKITDSFFYFRVKNQVMPGGTSAIAPKAYVKKQNISSCQIM